MSTDIIPIPCGTCGERWNHPAALITVVLLPGDCDELWAVCPDCGPDRLSLDHRTADLITYLYELDVIDWTRVAIDQLDTLEHGLRVWLRPAVMRANLDVELLQVVGHCDQTVTPFNWQLP